MKALAITCVLLSASTGFAQPKKVEAENAYKYGQSLYLKEDYEGAARQFKAAYDLDPDPVYLFNIAQSYRLGKQCKDAGAYYRQYLAKAKSPPNADAVMTYIVEVDECAKAQNVAVEPPKPDPPQQIDEPATPVEPVETPIVDEQPRSNKRVAGYIVGGGGAVIVGLGFYFMSRVASLEEDANNVCPGACTSWTPENTRDRARIDDKAHLNEKLMIGSWIAGGAALAAGVYLVVTGGEKRESSVAITPTRNGAMVSLSF